MFQNLKVFQLSQAMAQHAASRHAVVAQNIANADTPGYSSKDIVSFSKSYQSGAVSDPMKTTRSGHLANLNRDYANQSYKISQSNQSESLGGNSVSLETEMVKSIEAQRQHDRAISIYKSSLTMLRSSLGR